MVGPTPPLSARPGSAPGTALYSELDQSLGHLVRRSLQLHTAIWAEVVGNDLTLPQYTALSILRRSTGLSNAQLARRTYVTPQAMIEVTTRPSAD